MQNQIKEIESALEVLQKWDKDGIVPADGKEFINDVQNRIAPMAEELGLHLLQHDLQELSVKLGYPEDYMKLKKLRLESEMSCEMVFRTFALPIRAMLDDMGIEYDFQYRMKSIYSIWRKMRTKGAEFDEVYDLFATRIIYHPSEKVLPLPFAPKNEVDMADDAAPAIAWQKENLDAEKFCCWRIYTVISMLYRIHPERIRNWISHPKASGYQALQITVMGPDCNWIEIQIRSQRMNEEAENGVAAHWKYKQETALK